MKALLRQVNDHGVHYDALMFICPGCQSITPDEPNSGLHMLPVNTTEHSPSWEFDGNLDAPTLNPSILSDFHGHRCHSFLRAGWFEFLIDSQHPLSGKVVELPDLPDWVMELS